MTAPRAPAPPALPLPPRVLGRVAGSRPGPTLVILAGVHGNEPSGVAALTRVLAELQGRADQLAGDVVALAGNREAIAQEVRFLNRDLNRAWSPRRVQALRQRSERESLNAEDREQLELAAELDRAFREARGKTYVLDLHSTSGAGAPFVVLADTLRNRAFATPIAAPVVLGLEEQLEGTLLSYLSDQGHVTIAFEGGQHLAASTVDHAESAVWISLESTGIAAGKLLRRPNRTGRILEQAAAGLPTVVELRYRHDITPEDDFRMLPGFTNFQRVRAGQVLAYDESGPVRCPEDGLLLMPLYQKLGNDGFFLVRGFNPVWLSISASLRRMKADSIVHWLPGVRRHPEKPATYLINRAIARWYALEIFHLLGFRRMGELGKYLVVARRPHDVAADHSKRQDQPHRSLHLGE